MNVPDGIAELIDPIEVLLHEHSKAGDEMPPGQILFEDILAEPKQILPAPVPEIEPHLEGDFVPEFLPQRL
jgi:hypothetical protein